MTIQKNQFRLDVRIEKLAPMNIDVIDKVTVGLDPRSDIVLSGAKIKYHHMAFHKKGENLALQYGGASNQTFLNSLPLEEGKVYLLEPGDQIQVAGVEIIVRHEVIHVPERKQIHTIVFDSAADLKPENATEGILFKDNPTGSMKKQKHIRPPIIKRLENEIRLEIKEEMSLEKGTFITLWLVKFYALVADFFITYLIIVTLLPLVYAESYALVIINFFSSLIFQSGNHAFFKFFIAWYFFSFAQTMILGTTLGQSLTGLRNKNDSTYGKLILFRLKTFVFSLFLLPAQNTVSDKLFYKAMRKAGVPLLVVAILLSPLFLPTPYNQFIDISKDRGTLERELHTKTFRSESAILKMNLNADLSTQYLLLPYVYRDKGLRSFQMVDLKTGDKIIIHETEKFLYDEIDRILEFGNPLYSVLHSTAFRNLPVKSRKHIIQSVFKISPYNLKETAPKFGPFFGAAVHLKENLLEGMDLSDIILQSYAPETPLLHISNSQQDYFYLFTPDSLIRFVVESTDKKLMVAAFDEQVLSKLIHDDEIEVVRNNQRVEILEAQDAFLQGDEHTLLTYYVGIANTLPTQKIVHDEVDLTNQAKRAVISNLTDIQKFIKDRNVIKSFDDIKNQLTPMENPGEKR